MVKGHLSADFAKSKYVMLMLHFCKYHTNPTIHNHNKTTFIKDTFLAAYILKMEQPAL